MKDEKDKLLDHDYDGIKEYDNMLPKWWLNIFYASIVFSIIYFIYYHGGGGGKLPIQVFEEQQAEQRFQDLSQAKTEITFDEKDILPILKNSKNIEQGRAAFASRCVSCHGVAGGGIVGPNLTDDYWLHGGKVNQIAHTIFYGVPEKGMVAWEAMLSKEDVVNLAVYVTSLRGTRPANPKAPQGAKEEP